MIPGVGVNAWAILVSAIIYMIVGSLWYSPFMFGKRWMHLAGVEKSKDKSKSMAQTYAIAFVFALLMSFVVAHVAAYANADGFAEGMQTGFWLWLGLVVPVTLGGSLWEGRPWELFLINASCYLVSLLIVGGLVAAW